MTFLLQPEHQSHSLIFHCRLKTHLINRDVMSPTQLPFLLCPPPLALILKWKKKKISTELFYFLTWHYCQDHYWVTRCCMGSMAYSLRSSHPCNGCFVKLVIFRAWVIFSNSPNWFPAGSSENWGSVRVSTACTHAFERNDHNELS